MGKYSDLVRRTEPTNGSIHHHKPIDWLMELMPGQYAKFGDVIVGRVTITPAMAKVILEKCNKNNRNFRNVHGMRIKDAIARDEWKFNGETIIFDDAGNMTNGQHRLNGCEVAGKSIETLVVLGIEPGISSTIDVTTPRNGADRLGQLGFTSCTALQGACNHLWRLMTNNTANYNTASNQQMEVMIKKHPGLVRCVDFVVKMYHPIAVSKGMWATFLYVASVLDQEEAESFTRCILSGEFVVGEFSSAARLLRSRLDINFRSKSKLPGLHIFALVIKAWNAHYAGKVIKTLKWVDTEHFPKFNGIAYLDGKLCTPVVCGEHIEDDEEHVADDEEKEW